ALHLAVRVDGGAPAGLRGTPHLAVVVRRAKADPAFDGAEAIPNRAAALFGAEHLAVLIRGALASAAYDVSILILDAAPALRVGDDGQQETRDRDDSVFHDHFHLRRLTISPTMAVNCWVIS